MLRIFSVMQERSRNKMIKTCLVLILLGFASCANDDARIVEATSEMEALRVKLAVRCVYFTDDYPTDEEGLSLLLLTPVVNIQKSNAGFTSTPIPNGPLVEKPSDLVDPWGTPYRYTKLLIGCLLTCAGPDRQFGTEDDIKKSSNKTPEHISEGRERPSKNAQR
jgi:hypothetical protein